MEGQQTWEGQQFGSRLSGLARQNEASILGRRGDIANRIAFEEGRAVGGLAREATLLLNEA